MSTKRLLNLFAGGLMLSASALEIIDAKFGGENAWANATDKMAEFKINDELYVGYKNGIDMIGRDPLPGKPKAMIIKYKDHDREYTVRFDSSRYAVSGGAPAISGKDFNFFRAWYGDGKNFADVTTDIRKVIDSKKEIQINPDTCGGKDPAPDRRKGLYIFYVLDNTLKTHFLQDGEKFKASDVDGSYSPIPLAKEITSPFTDIKLDTAVWQWSVPMRGIQQKAANPSTAWLYIPPKTRKLRGVVVGIDVMLERPIMEHPKFREYLQQLDYGCIWLAQTPFFSGFDYRNQVYSSIMDNVFTDLAIVSGYDELATIPFIGLGHSASSCFPYYLAMWRPERAISGISYDGNVPDLITNNRDRIINEQNFSRICGIPFFVRQSGLFGGAGDFVRKMRTAYPAFAVSVVADPGSGHFDINDQIIDYIGRYMVKTDKIRRVGTMPLAKVNPADGWAIDIWRNNDEPKFPAAPLQEFKGDNGFNWVYDEEHARMQQRHEALYRGKKVQLLAYVQDGKILPDRKTHFQIHPRFTPEKDGLSFKLKGAFLDTVTPGRALGWTRRKAGEKIEHGNDPENIRILPCAGPVVKIDKDTLAVRFDRYSLFPGKTSTAQIAMIAVHPGDDVYRRTVLQSELQGVGLNFNAGMDQYITFPPINDVKAGTKSVKLDAVCNTGMPVEYFVMHGPAYILNRELIFTEIPPSANFPIEVEVTAWQLGRMRDPALKTAKPVTRKFHLSTPAAGDKIE